MDKKLIQKLNEILDKSEKRGRKKISSLKMRRFEKEMNTDIADDYKEFLYNYSSCYLKDDYFFPMKEISELTDENGLETMDFFYNTEFIDDSDDFIGLWGDKVLPIGESSGDYICIGIREENKGKIYMLYHEDEKREDGLYLIADSFSDFILSFRYIEQPHKEVNCVIEWNL